MLLPREVKAPFLNGAVTHFNLLFVRQFTAKTVDFGASDGAVSDKKQKLDSFYSNNPGIHIQAHHAMEHDIHGVHREVLLKDLVSCTMEKL